VIFIMVFLFYMVCLKGFEFEWGVGGGGVEGVCVGGVCGEERVVSPPLGGCVRVVIVVTSLWVERECVVGKADGRRGWIFEGFPRT